MTEPKIIIKYAPRNWTAFKRPVWSDPRPFTVYVDGKVAKDKKGNERRFSSEAGAKKAFT
jgi:hypothetical protein